MQLAVTFGFFPPDPAAKEARRRRWVALGLILSLLIHGALTLWLFDPGRRAPGFPFPAEAPVVEATLERVRPEPPQPPPPQPEAAVDAGGGGGGSSPPPPPTPIHRAPIRDPLVTSPFVAPPPTPPRTFEPIIVPPAPVTAPQAVAEGLARGAGDGTGDGAGSGQGPGSGSGSGGGSGSGNGSGVGSGRGAVIVPPDWKRPPRPPELTRFYPREARRKGVTGRVVLDCLATRFGKAKDCRVVAEGPEGYWFGEAALLESRYFELRPMTVNGKPQDSRLQINLGYVVPPGRRR